MNGNSARRLHEGDHVTAMESGGRRISGKVEQTAPDMGAAWVREDGFGARHLITTEDLVDSPRETIDEPGR
ncbi:hypothetical protein GCM10023081_01310 [Arthrobacter ginkgonis]|uniref:DUF1918 domain-containing protein n=1 Tax=Arthrobacter ginkgonis TaxID=1630594 RepID=A0ABP7BPF2_9MICC